MKAPLSLRRWMDAIIKPSSHPDLEKLLQAGQQRVPVLWLLGKTGAGKSSIVQRLTGDSQARVGNGFAPCTRTAEQYNHPQDMPVMRFLDTRGLGESEYDPTEDLSTCQSAAHAILLIMRVDDPDQSSLIQVVSQLNAISGKHRPLLLVHSALHSIPRDDDRQRAMAANYNMLSQTLKSDIPSVAIDFPPPDEHGAARDHGLAELEAAIVDLVPALQEVLACTPESKNVQTEREQTLFNAYRREIIGYASAAATVDLLPAVGLVTVPAIQGKMLHSLAGRYDIAWTQRSTTEFLATLGTGFLYRYALSLMGRQFGKLIPVYGQSVGAAAAASISFASTYALGRVACLYLYRKKMGESADPAALREAFRAAFKEQTRSDTGNSSTTGKSGDT